MADVNRDLDRYLRKRREERTSYNGPSWFDRIFSSANTQDQRELTPREQRKLEKVEHDIERTEREVAMVHELEEHLEEEQEEKVGLYHQLLRFFKRDNDQSNDVVEIPTVPVEDETVKDDFREVGRIATSWLSRLPSRIRDDFRSSDDYKKMTEILERRGVARKR